MNRLMEKLDGWVVDALSGSSVPDGFEWETALLVVPNEQGMQPAFMLFMSIPSPILGDRIPSAGIGLNPHTLGESTIKQMVVNGLTGLYNARSEALKAQLPETNGHLKEVIGRSVEWPSQG